jgi:hypothetical protein
MTCAPHAQDSDGAFRQGLRLICATVSTAPKISVQFKHSDCAIGEPLWKRRHRMILNQTKSTESGGGGGIRTPGGLAPTTVFKTVALNRSATPPKLDRTQTPIFKPKLLVFQCFDYPLPPVFKTRGPLSHPSGVSRPKPVAWETCLWGGEGRRQLGGRPVVR